MPELCILGSSPAVAIGIFDPEGAWEEFIAFKVKPDQQPVCVYGVCEECFTLPSEVLAGRVEDKLRRNAAEVKN